MQDPRLRDPFGARPRPPGLIARVIGVAIGAVALVAALFFSVIVFAVLLAVGAIVGAWLWWQTREVRREMREQMREQMRQQMRQQTREGEAGTRARGTSSGGPAPHSDGGGGDVIEGDYIRETDRRRDGSGDA